MKKHPDKKKFSFIAIFLIDCKTKYKYEVDLKIRCINVTCNV